MRGLPELRGDPLAGCDVALRLGDAAEQQERAEPVHVPVHDALGVVDRDRHLEQLGAERQHLLDGVGPGDRDRAPVERVGERRGVAATARELHRLAAQLVAPRARRLVAQRTRQPREQPDAQRAVVLAERGEALLEQREEALVGAAAGIHDPPAILRRRPRELGSQAEPARDADRRRRIVLPQRVDQRVTRDDAIRVEQQQRQQRPLLEAAHLQRPPVGVTSSGPRMRNSIADLRRR